MNNNPVRYIDPSGHAFCQGYDGGCTGDGKSRARYIRPEEPAQPPIISPVRLQVVSVDLDETGPITSFLLGLPFSAEKWRDLATVFDLLAWLTDLSAAGAVTYGGIYGAGLTAPLIASGLPEVPVATGFAGMAIAELWVQPILNIGNGLATLSTLSTLTSETKAGTTRVEEGRLSDTVMNSTTLTVYGWVNKEAYISLILQSVAVANDLGRVHFSVPGLKWNSVPFPTIP